MAADPRKLMLGMALGLAVLATPAMAQNTGANQVEKLHKSLHLSPEQESAWTSYRAQAGASSEAQNRRRAANQMFAKLAAPQRMDLIAAEMRADLADLERQSQALKVFYATLTPAQQRTFDSGTLPPRQDQD